MRFVSILAQTPGFDWPVNSLTCLLRGQPALHSYAGVGLVASGRPGGGEGASASPVLVRGGCEMLSGPAAVSRADRIWHAFESLGVLRPLLWTKCWNHQAAIC